MCHGFKLVFKGDNMNASEYIIIRQIKNFTIGIKSFEHNKKTFYYPCYKKGDQIIHQLEDQAFINSSMTLGFMYGLIEAGAI